LQENEIKKLSVKNFIGGLIFKLSKKTISIYKISNAIEAVPKAMKMAVGHIFFNFSQQKETVLW